MLFAPVRESGCGADPVPAIAHTLRATSEKCGSGCELDHEDCGACPFPAIVQEPRP